MAGSNPCWEGRLPGLVGENHGFPLAKTELEFFQELDPESNYWFFMSGTWTGIFEKKQKNLKKKKKNTRNKG